MTDAAETDAARPLLSCPAVERQEYPANLIRQVVCEVRFPTLLELETEHPVAFQRALRKDYPSYERGMNVSVTLGKSESDQAVQHVFKSKDRRWTIGLRASSVSLDTTGYRTFPEFLERLLKVVSLLDPLLDTDFYTRVGLRYINVLPVAVDDLSGWVNQALVSSLVGGAFGRPTRYWQEISGVSESGPYSMRHGLDPTRTADHKLYYLDADFYLENVEKKDLKHLVSRFHGEAYKLFEWSIGDKAREHMRKPSSTGGRSS